MVQGTREDIENNRSSNDFSIIGDFRVNMFKEKKGIFAAAIFLLAILAGTLEWAPLSITFMAAALLTVISGALNIDRVYQVINWKLLILIGGMTAFGTAMENSGASKYLAENILNLLGHLGPLYVMGGFVILVILLTQPMSNAAAALVVLPVAIDTAVLDFLKVGLPLTLILFILLMIFVPIFWPLT